MMCLLLYINLDESIDRRSRMEKQLANAPDWITVKRISALRGLPSDPNPFQKSRGQIGCLKSHILCYSEAIQQKAKFVVILEDDVQLANNFFDVLKETLISAENIEWNLIYLSGIIFHDVGLSVKSPQTLYSTNHINGTHSLLVSEKAYRKIISLYQTHQYNADDALHLLDKKWLTFPFITRCIHTESTISNDDISQRIKAIDRMCDLSHYPKADSEQM